MRWRFVDKIDAFTPWQEIRGKKAASFEECKLLNRLGRDGDLPESIALEACVDQVRRLVEKSSGYGQTALLQAVEGFEFFRSAVAGEVLDIDVRVTDRGAEAIDTQCRIMVRGDEIARGRLRLSLVPLEEHLDGDVRQMLWKEAHGAA